MSIFVHFGVNAPSDSVANYMAATMEIIRVRGTNPRAALQQLQSRANTKSVPRRPSQAFVLLRLVRLLSIGILDCLCIDCSALSHQDNDIRANEHSHDTSNDSDKDTTILPAPPLYESVYPFRRHQAQSFVAQAYS